MIDNVGKFYIVNGGVKSTEGMPEIDTHKFKVVYEVIRIIEKVPLYLEAHYLRLESSHKMLGLTLKLGFDKLKAKIRKLVDENRLTNCNVKLIMYHQDGVQNYMLYISKSYYPSMDEISEGVHTSLFQWVREDPNAKVVNQNYKDEVARRMQENNAFEVLLVNDEGVITEGSRSNMFFIKGSKAYTTPGNLVLKGITRQYIIEACQRVGVDVAETLMPADKLKDIEGLFISGTSIKVLPVASVDGLKFNSSEHPVVTAIRLEFDRMIDEYVKANS